MKNLYNVMELCNLNKVYNNYEEYIKIIYSLAYLL